jgi:hypothetical protein
MFSASEVGLRREKMLAQNFQKQSKKAERAADLVETLLLMDIKSNKIFRAYLTNKKL